MTGAHNESDPESIGHQCGRCPPTSASAAAGAAELAWFYSELGARPGGTAGLAQFVSCSMSRLIGK